LETIAVYWESKVKVYSITHVTDLSMSRIIFPFKAAEQLGKMLLTLEDPVQRFELVTQDYIDAAFSQLTLFYDRSRQQAAGTIMKKWGEEIQTRVTQESPLELVYLHGPHFQDRFGIIDIAFTALKNSNIEIITTGCAGNTIYIVLPDKRAHFANQVLRETFVIPTSN